MGDGAVARGRGFLLGLLPGADPMEGGPGAEDALDRTAGPLLTAASRAWTAR